MVILLLPNQCALEHTWLAVEDVNSSGQGSPKDGSMTLPALSLGVSMFLHFLEKFERPLKAKLQKKETNVTFLVPKARGPSCMLLETESSSLCRRPSWQEMKEQLPLLYMGTEQVPDQRLLVGKQPETKEKDASVGVQSCWLPS